ncbi:MAG: hypothetical protein JWN48_1813 [Myxococcaceae bacterium]|nr:hypothetical protein [Myxococcaceae bacterium]
MLSPLCFLLADVQNGMGPYVTVFLTASAGWDAASMGLALAVQNIAQVAAQTPAGALIDRLPRTRELIAFAAALVACACVAIALSPTRAFVLPAQVAIGIAGSLIPSAIAALSLGLVGRAEFDRRMGRNQAWNAAGNVAAAVLIGTVGALLPRTAMFYAVAALSIAALVTVLRIPLREIDFTLVRGADIDPVPTQRDEAEARRPSTPAPSPEGLVALLRDARLLRLLVGCVLFHMANAAMLPLVTQLLSRGADKANATLYTATYMVGAQLVWMGVAAWAGSAAMRRGRKAVFMIAFLVLPVRGLLYTVSHATAWLIAVQVLDGIGAGIFGVVSVLMIADLTRGSGRFNVAQGALNTAVGIGAGVSNLVTGLVVAHAGADTALRMLSAVALLALLWFWRMVPETRGVHTAAAQAGSTALHR